MNRDYFLLPVPIFSDTRGDLGVIEGKVHIPFEIARVFFIANVPSGKLRAAHALLTCQQVIIPVRGSVVITVETDGGQETIHLNKAAQGLYLAPEVWRELKEFSPDCVCLVLASERYDKKAYYEEYTTWRSRQRR